MSDWINNIFDELERPVVSEGFRDALFYQMYKCIISDEEEILFGDLILSDELTMEQANELMGRFKLNERCFQEIENPSSREITEHVKKICGLS
ncbi:hypothetical protein OAA64_01955 [bacterium]|nr:hypothetical protein [bacterium]